MFNLSSWKDNPNPSPDATVLHFIDALTNHHDYYIQTYYTKGKCYYFAQALYQRFPHNSYIWYDSLHNHFYCEIDSVLYDATGPISPNKFTETEKESIYIWQDYRRIDPIHSQRIINNCIYFIDNDEDL